MPTITLATIPVAPATVDAGNTITFEALAQGGSLPYVYTFYVYNTVTLHVVNTVVMSSNTFVFPTNTNLIGNTLNANVFVTDAAGAVANSILTGTFTVNSVPTITLATIPVAPATVDAGNTITFEALAQGGSLPYVYTFYVYNTVTLHVVNTVVMSSNTFVFPDKHQPDRKHAQRKRVRYGRCRSSCKLHPDRNIHGQLRADHHTCNHTSCAGNG